MSTAHERYREERANERMDRHVHALVVEQENRRLRALLTALVKRCGSCVLLDSELEDADPALLRSGRDERVRATLFWVESPLPEPDPIAAPKELPDGDQEDDPARR